jgi:hypothetical protein
MFLLYAHVQLTALDIVSITYTEQISNMLFHSLFDCAWDSSLIFLHTTYYIKVIKLRLMLNIVTSLSDQ